MLGLLSRNVCDVYCGHIFTMFILILLFYK